MPLPEAWGVGGEPEESSTALAFTEPAPPPPGDIRLVPSAQYEAIALPVRRRAAYNRLDKFLSDLLSDLYRGRQWLTDPSYAYKRDPDFVAKVWRDPVIGKAILSRSQEVIGGDYYFEAPAHPHGKRMAAAYTEIFSGIGRFHSTLLHWAKAFFFGSEWAKILGGHKLADPCRSGSKRWWWLPRAVQPMDRRRWHREWSSFDAKTVDGKHREKRINYWALYNPYAQETQIPEPMEMELYIQHVWMDEERAYGFGWGISDGLALYWEAKQTLLKYLLVGLERYAWPWVVIKTDEASQMFDADLGTAHSTTRQLLSKFRKMRMSGVMVIDKDDDVDTLAVDGRQTDGLLNAMRYLDKGAVEYIRGASMADGGHGKAEGGGSRARSQTEAESASTYSTAYDAPILEETINTKLVRIIHKYNAGNFEAAGFADCPPAIFHLGRQKRTDPLKDLNVLTQLLGLPIAPGSPPIRLKMSDVLARAGHQAASPEDIASGDYLEAGGAPAGGAMPGMPSPSPMRMASAMTPEETARFFAAPPMEEVHASTDSISEDEET